MESRKSSRFAVQLPLSFTEAQRASNGVILNISREGCMVTAEQVPVVPNYLQLDMQLREGQQAVRVELAAVRWSSGRKFGLEFIKLGADQQERLAAFLTMLEENALS